MMSRTPFWAACYALIGFGATAVLMADARRRWDKTGPGHWTVRAVALHRLRLLAANAPLAVSLVIGLGDFAVYGPPFREVALCWIVGWVGALAAVHRYVWNVQSDITEAENRAQVFKTAFSFGIGSALVIAGVLAGDSWSWGCVAVVTVAVLRFALAARSRPWLSSHGYLKPPDERLARIVQDSAASAGVPPPEVWIAVSPWSNAYADVLYRRLYFTERLLRDLSDSQLAAVCAHELAHLAESKAVVVARLVGRLAYSFLVLIGPAVATFRQFGVIALTTTVYFVSVGCTRLSLLLERRADRAAKAAEEDAGIYASALERLYAANLVPAVLRVAERSHPNLYDRMIAAGVAPDFPRPAAPKIPWIVHGLWMVFGLTLFAALQRAASTADAHP